MMINKKNQAYKNKNEKEGSKMRIHTVMVEPEIPQNTRKHC